MQNKVMQVLKHEVYIITNRLSFWIMFLLPLIAISILWGITLGRQNNLIPREAMGNPLEAVGDYLTPKEDNRPQGYLDDSGLIQTIPVDFPQETFIAFPDMVSARKALDAGEISAFYAISADYSTSGRITVYMPEYKFDLATNSQVIENLINYNLLGGDDALYHGFVNPITELERVNLSSQSKTTRENNSTAALAISFVITGIIYTGIFGSSTMLLSSLTHERENRVLEVLMLSTSPLELITGKIIGLGLVGLLQMAVWVPGSVLYLRIGGTLEQLPKELMVDPSFITWGILFFVFGYALFAVIMAGIGALVPSTREASQITTIVMFPAIIPQMLIPFIAQDPNGALAVILSLVPVTSPFTIIMRLTMGPVPQWQILLALLLLAGTILLSIRLVAGLMRAQTIMTGNGFHLSKFVKAILDVMF